jgi:hypothetical protein
MRATIINGQCQRVGCGKSGQLFRIDGELFEADRERGVEAGQRLYCQDCANGIIRTAEHIAGERLR